MSNRLLLAGSALLLAGAIFRGGSVAWVGLAALLLALVTAAPVLVGRAPRPALTPLGLGAVLLLAGFVAWNGVSVLWSTRPDRSWDYVNLGLVYLAFLACGVLAGARLPLRALSGAFAAVLGAAAVWALAGKVFPGLYPDYERVARLRGPVGYWNALALLGDFALPLGLWVATRTRARAAGMLLVYAWVVAILLAFSRGGVLVAVVVVAVWLVVDTWRLESLAALALGGIPALVVTGIAFGLDGITEDGQSAAVRANDGRVFGVVLLIDAAVVVAAARVRILPGQRRAAGRALAVVAGAAVLAAAVGLALHAGRFWNDFASSQPVGSGAGRIGSTSSNFRLEWWKQAARGLADRPVLGSGAGSFQYTNLRLRTSSFDQTLEPHDLPLQFLSETGIVGFLLVLGAAVLAFVAILRRLTFEREPAALALALVPLAYVLHGLLDYDWDFLAVTGPAVLAAGALLARPGTVAGRSYLGAVAAVSGTVAVFGSLLLPWLAHRDYLDALAASPARAIELTREAHSLNPLAIDPLFVQAEAQYALGSRRRAWELYLRAAQIQRDNKEAWFRLGEFELEELGCPQLAYPHLKRFVELDPQGPGGEVYKAALAAVNSGKARC